MNSSVVEKVDYEVRPRRITGDAFNNRLLRSLQCCQGGVLGRGVNTGDQWFLEFCDELGKLHRCDYISDPPPGHGVSLRKGKDTHDPERSVLQATH